MMYDSHSVAETEEIAARLAQTLTGGTVVAFRGGLGMGKTAFVRGMAQGLGLTAEVSSPTFALVHEYGGLPPLVHFDMYRVSGWDDLYSTGFFEYIDMGCILAVEWSENIEAALPERTVRVTITSDGGDDRRITIEGNGYEDIGT